MQTIRLIAKKAPETLSREEKTVLSHFHGLGCTSCHQVVLGEVRLTEEGKKLSLLHLGCPEIMQAISK
jgi:hypothetical protein